jgi:hypothetical protein
VAQTPSVLFTVNGTFWRIHDVVSKLDEIAYSVLPKPIAVKTVPLGTGYPTYPNAKHAGPTPRPYLM